MSFFALMVPPPWFPTAPEKSTCQPRPRSFTKSRGGASTMRRSFAAIRSFRTAAGRRSKIGRNDPCPCGSVSSTSDARRDKPPQNNRGRQRMVTRQTAHQPFNTNYECVRRLLLPKSLAYSSAQAFMRRVNFCAKRSVSGVEKVSTSVDQKRFLASLLSC